MTRERDRYGRASAGEQFRGAFLSFWRNRTARILAAIILTVGLILLLLTPEIVPLSRVAGGDCLYLRPPGPSDLDIQPQIPGSPIELAPFDEVERASCDLSHSHEVSAVFAVGAAGDAYPGLTALVDANGPRCGPAFEAYVGRALAGSRYGTAVWVPSDATWGHGVRTGACVVFSADLGMLDHRAGGSRE